MRFVNSALFDKISTLDIPEQIYNWLVEYHLERSHLTIFKGYSSSLLPINASMVQGSVLGPTNFSITGSDLALFSPLILCSHFHMIPYWILSSSYYSI